MLGVFGMYHLTTPPPRSFSLSALSLSLARFSAKAFDWFKQGTDAGLNQSPGLATQTPATLSTVIARPLPSHLISMRDVDFLFLQALLQPVVGTAGCELHHRVSFDIDSTHIGPRLQQLLNDQPVTPQDGKHERRVALLVMRL